MRPRIADPAAGSSWVEWMRALGRRVRHVREFLGLTQDELDRRAALVGGATRRLAPARALAPQLVGWCKSGGSLHRPLAKLNRAIRSPAAPPMVDEALSLAPPGPATESPDSPLTSDPA